MTGPALAYARDTLEIVDEFRPDVIVSNELLLGVMTAAEASGRPLALLTANAWCYPTRNDVPPFGPGFPKSEGKLAKWRDASTRKLVSRFYDAGLEDLNAARVAIGLGTLTRTLDQLQIAERIVLGVSPSFDYRAENHEPFVYAGPLIETPSWAPTGVAPCLGGRPKVLISFGTTYQNQKPAIERCIRALARLDVDGLVTLGPAVSPEGLPEAPNVTVVQAASHDEIVPGSAVVVCHGGHGTVLRPIMHGFPVLCLPMGRDHPENAARIASRGAGLRISDRSSPRVIAAAVRRLIEDRSFREAAVKLGAEIREETDGGATAAAALLGMVQPRGRFPQRRL